MYSKKLIKQVYAALLLLVFTVGITPRLFLHTLFANHKDSRCEAVSHYGNPQHLSKTKLSCDCENIVAESPFTSEDGSFHLTYPPGFTDQPEYVRHFFHPAYFFFFSLRGPPVAG